jgi:hypothetical protein
MSRKDIDIHDTRQTLWARSRGRCEVCGELLNPATWQMAHRIPQTKAFLRAHGAKVIHHPLNLSAAHPMCNVKVSLQNKPMERARLVQRIEEEMQCKFT